LIPESPAAATLGRARKTALGLLAAVAVVWILAAVDRVGPPAPSWTAPAALLAVVSPVVGYRVYHWLGSRVPGGAGAAAVDRAWLRATRWALSVTAAAAMLCGLGYLFHRDPSGLLGPAMHVLLTGALWPSIEKRRAFELLAASKPPVE